jgi:hypothetical protein
MKKFAVISAAVLMIGFSGTAATAQEKSKSRQA